MIDINLIDIIIDLMTRFWQFTVLGILIIIGFAINLSDKLLKGKKVDFEYEDYPHMQPIRIATKDKGFWGAILMWLLGTRKWRITQNFNYKIKGQEYVIPKGFEFDGASVPKFLATFLSPVGVLLIGGLIHDYAYKFACLKPRKDGPLLVLNQKEADKIFRDINIEINGFHFLNYLAYWALRIGGFLAWNKHRKVDAKIED
jgi:hypothetical protein